MLRLLTPALCGLAVVGLAAPASAATLSADRSCYTAGLSPIGLTGTGFAPDGPVDVNAGGAGGGRLTADPAGAFRAPLLTPTGASLGLQGMQKRSLTITATDAAGTLARTTVDVVLFAFRTEGGQRSPRATRTWRFSGFPDRSKPIYGHFRFGGRTITNYRFGKPRGACGMLTARAPGIPARVRTGLWTIQIDQRRTYQADTKPALKVQSPVTLRPVFR
jgi:hypothetical protein